MGEKPTPAISIFGSLSLEGENEDEYISNSIGRTEQLWSQSASLLMLII